MKLTVSKNVFAFAITLFAGADLAYGAARHGGYAKDLYETDHEALGKSISSIESKGDKNFDVKLCGRVREEFFYWDKSLFFGADNDDVIQYFRSKVELGAAVKQGSSSGSLLSEGVVKLGAYNYWLVNNTHDRPVTETTTLGAFSGTGSARPVVTGDAHFHTDIVPRISLEEAWYKINFGSFVNVLKDHPISLKAGYFAYTVGRGLTLGTMSDLGPIYSGWAGQGAFVRYPFTPPGILLQGKLSDSLSWDLYYSKGRSNDGDFNRKYAPAYANRLNGAAAYSPPHLGKGKDRDIFSARLDLSTSLQSAKFNFQPYFVYTDAPVLPVEFDADSKASFSTVGMMTEFDTKGFNVNIEVAGQFGTQQMFACDRNIVLLGRDTATGNVQEQFSHVRLSNAVSGDSAPVVAGLTGVVNLDGNRGVAQNGLQLRTAAGVPVTIPMNGVQTNVMNSNLWGNQRIRPAYKLNYGGLMGLADVAYNFASSPLKVAAAVGYIGGDKYPFNEEKDKTYKTFITQRSMYTGREVKSIMIFEQQQMLRPTNMVYRLQAAETNQRDYTNLQFVGTSATWYPFKNKNKLSIQPNIIGFWEVSQLKKWDKNAQFNLPNDAANQAKIRSMLASKEIVGWESDQDASKCLGIELNTYLNYQIFDNCNCYLVGWVFKPGQLYKDLEGQPINSFGKRATASGGTKMLGQGSMASVGFYTGIDYKF